MASLRTFVRMKDPREEEGSDSKKKRPRGPRFPNWIRAVH